MISYLRQGFGLLRAAIRNADRHNLPLVAAGVAFYGLLALFPGLAALVSIYGLVGDPSDIGRELEAFRGIAPPSILQTARTQIDALLATPDSRLALQSAASVLLSFWSAQQGVRSFVHALNIVYDDTRRRSLLPRFGFGFLFTVAGVALAAVTVAVFSLTPIVLKFLGMEALLPPAFLRWAATTSLVIGFLLALYRWGPNRPPPRMRILVPGALVAALSWLLASGAFSLFMRTIGISGQIYGSVASAVVLLLWLFVSTYLFLLGAEVNAQLEREGRLKSSASTPPLSGSPAPPA